MCSFYLCLNKKLSKQSWSWWFETPSRSLWRHCNEIQTMPTYRLTALSLRGLLQKCGPTDKRHQTAPEQPVVSMMTSSNGNIFRVTGPLGGEFTGDRWIPRTNASGAELWYILWSAPWISVWVNNREAGDLKRHRSHYDVIVMGMKHPAKHCDLECASYTKMSMAKRSIGGGSIQKKHIFAESETNSLCVLINLRAKLVTNGDNQYHCRIQPKNFDHYMTFKSVHFKESKGNDNQINQ